MRLIFSMLYMYNYVDMSSLLHVVLNTHDVVPACHDTTPSNKHYATHLTQNTFNNHLLRKGYALSSAFHYDLPDCQLCHNDNCNDNLSKL